MTCEQQLKRFHTDDIHYPNLGIAPDWLKQISLPTGPIRSITQNQVVTRHQCGISLQSLLRRHFAGKLVVVVLENVCCFLLPCGKLSFIFCVMLHVH